MSKRKPATASKHAHGARIAAKAQRPLKLLSEARKRAFRAPLAQTRTNRLQSVMRTHNKTPSSLRIRIRRQPYKMTPN
jgi:hypothetical protein